MGYDLIIFDCDGTLVHTEPVYIRSTATLLQKYGLSEYDEAACMRDFHGVSWDKIKILVEQKHNMQLPDDICEQYVETAGELLSGDLEEAKGATALIESLPAHIDYCIGSNGEWGNLLRSLELTKLDRFFSEDRIFTKKHVVNPKPAPDLFLHAAKMMGHDPSRAIVVEDSATGVAAGKAAGIFTFGYTGTSSDPEETAAHLKDAGASEIISRLDEILPYIR